MDKQDNSLVNKFLKQISKIIDHKLEKLTTVESAIVDQVNIDGSVNLHIPPDSTIFTGVQNQSIYQNLKVGDCVKVLKQNNKASNMWIIGGHNLKRDDTIVDVKAIDYIVDEGVSGIWTYRKWNSGIYDAWFMNNELGATNYQLCPCGTYVSENQYSFAAPFGNITSYVGTASAHATWSWGAIWGSNTGVSLRIMAISDISGSLGRCSLYITGTWK